MKIVRPLFAVSVALLSEFVFAQYGTPETLRAELVQGGDLVFSSDPKELGTFTNFSNELFVPERKEGSKLPALVVFHTCGGISQHIRYWTEEALKEGYVVLVPDSMRGLKSDCGSPPQIPNARFVKDALDAVAHLAVLPYVDAKRISILGFSKGAFVATWLTSPGVANALRPGTPIVASAISVYGFCSLGPTRGRPQGAVILQPDTNRPLLMLMGGKDNETPPASCLEQLPKLKEAGAPVEWHLYPDATHGWDSADKDGFSKIAYNNERVTYRYDPAATADTRKRVFDFLSKFGGSR
ncbi:MAG TPA: dienelactone hydrolase family protein [Azonexus sp.]|nr:dienelactone hydrolase family protein [Azonexus sp.]